MVGDIIADSRATSPGIRKEVLKDCTEEEKAKIAGGNAARIYHLN
jgi:predicted TIM-barrel fold metal-dependent hydrolase